jgi:hypothetical protein
MAAAKGHKKSDSTKAKMRERKLGTTQTTVHTLGIVNANRAHAGLDEIDIETFEQSQYEKRRAHIAKRKALIEAKIQAIELWKGRWQPRSLKRQQIAEINADFDRSVEQGLRLIREAMDRIEQIYVGGK